MYKKKFSIKGSLSKCDQIRSFLQIWSHLLKKSLMEYTAYDFDKYYLPEKYKAFNFR